MRGPVHFIPIVTTLVALVFAWVLFGRYRERRPSPHLAWWAAGVLMYAVGTLTEASVTLLGWNEPTFRAWYISGALLGGAPLAQGTVYLMLPRRTANCLTALLVPFIVVAATCVLLTPVDYSLVEAHRLTGQVMEWTWVRGFSPFINLYAVIFLAGARCSRRGASATAPQPTTASSGTASSRSGPYFRESAGPSRASDTPNCCT